MSALIQDELSSADRQPLPKPDPFADAMALFRKACPPRDLSKIDAEIEAQLARGDLES